MVRYEVDVKANDYNCSHIVHGERFDTLKEAKDFCRKYVIRKDVCDCSIYKIDTSRFSEDEYASENQVWVIDCSIKNGKVYFSPKFDL